MTMAAAPAEAAAPAVSRTAPAMTTNAAPAPGPAARQVANAAPRPAARDPGAIRIRSPTRSGRGSSPETVSETDSSPDRDSVSEPEPETQKLAEHPPFLAEQQRALIAVPGDTSNLSPAKHQVEQPGQLQLVALACSAGVVHTPGSAGGVVCRDDSEGDFEPDWGILRGILLLATTTTFTRQA